MRPYRVSAMIVLCTSAAICQPAAGQAIPPEVQRQAWRICYVTVKDQDGSTSHGSGVIVDGNWLMSAHHVFRQADGSAPLDLPCHVTTVAHGRRSARLRGWSRECDVAVAAFDQPLGAIEPLAIAEPPAPGEPCWGAGHAAADPLATWVVGRSSTRQTRPNWCSESTGHDPAHQGQSGGPCFDQYGRLCGIVSQSDHHTDTLYSDLRMAAERGAIPDGLQVTEQVLFGARNRRALLPWNAGSRAGTCPPSPRQGGRQPINQPPVVHPPLVDVPQPAPRPDPIACQPGPAGPAGPPGADATITDEHLRRIADIITERMAANPDQWRGPAGPAGPRGESPSIASIVSQLPPITIAVENYDGSTKTATKRLGESFTIKFFRPPTQSQAQTDAASIR